MKNDIILQLSLRSIRLNFLRSLLAAIGIVIGVVAISSMGMMGTNMSLSVTEELSAMANVLVVKPGSGSSGGGMMGGGGPPGGGSSDEDDFISKSQFEDIERTAGKYGQVYPVYQESETIEVSDREGRATIYGMRDEDMASVLTIGEGALPKTSSSVAIGPTLAENYGLTIGSRITLGDEDKNETVQKVRVVGILEEKGMSMDLNSDSAIIMPEKAYVGRFGGEGEFTQVNIILSDIEDADAATEAIENQMNRKEEEVMVQDSSRMMDSITSTVSTLTTFVMAIAGISLLVAATSIFNVMMMSVTERVREIGILRSIGTQKNEVLRMFIYEAVILGLVGAGIGAVMCLVLGWLVVLVMVGTTKFFFMAESLIYVPMAMAIGIAICIFSGVYPAWRAANLDPIEALRAD